VVRKHRLAGFSSLVYNKLNTLTSRLVAGVMVIHLILLPILFGAVLYLVKEGYQNQFVEHIRSTSPLYAQMIRADDEEALLVATLDDILLSGQVIFVELKTPEGKRITSSLGNPDEKFNEDFFFGQHNDYSYYISIPVIDREGSGLGTLRLGYSEQLTLAQIEQLYQRSIVISVGYFLLSILFVVLSNTLLMRSIRQIGDTSQAIAKGELEQAFVVKSSIGEINHLTENLEYMRMTLFRDRQEIQDREARIHAIVDNMAEGVFTIDERGIVESFNQAAEQIFGYYASEVIGQNISILIDDSIAATHDKHIQNYLETGVSTVIGNNRAREIAGKHKAGHSISLEISISELRQGNRRIFSGIVRDITERAAQRALLEYQATHDALTGLPNRMLCLDRLQQMLNRSRREKNTSALLLLDLNLFKQVNDNYGHEYGDELLKVVAEQLRSATRESDTVARFGGDEFVALLPGQDAEGAISVANNMIHVINKPYLIKDQKLKIGTSIGIAIYPTHGEDEHSLMRSADEAMYRSKRRGLGYQLSVPDS